MATQRGGKLRIHVQESRNSLDVFRVTEQRLRPVIESVPGLAERVEISYGADREALDRGLAEAEVILVGNFEAENLRARAPRLAWVQSIFAGVERILPLIPEDVALTNGSGIHAPKAGEYGICALLMLNSNVPRFVAAKARKAWDPVFTPVIAGKTVAVLGTGSLGTAVAERARQFGMRVVGISRSGRAGPAYDTVHPVSDRLAALAGADFLVVTLPDTPETRGLVSTREFAALPRGAGLVSIGRGPVVDEAAMVEALRSGQLGGAVLDVFETEPLPPDSPLWTLDNVIISAHCAVDDLDAYLQRATGLFAANLQRYLEGRPLENVVDRTLGY